MAGKEDFVQWADNNPLIVWLVIFPLIFHKAIIAIIQIIRIQMASSKSPFINRISNVLESRVLPLLDKTLNKIENIFAFSSRFFYSLLINMIVLYLILLGISFGSVIVVLFGLLVIDFFTTQDGESSNGSEFISMVSEEFFSMLAHIFNLISNVLEYISTNYLLQGIAFFLLFIIITKQLIKSGISIYLDKAKTALNGCKRRFIWAFEPINLFQPKKINEEE